MNRVPREILLIILAVVLLLAGCSAGPGPSVASTLSVARVGEPAPDFQFQDLDGQEVSLSDFQGEPVLINFWATWCPPCVSEMPYLQEIYEEWTGEGLVMMTINMGESPSKVESFMQTYNLSLPVVLDTTKDITQKYNITGIPTTFFIDKDGIIREKVIGAFPNKERIEQCLIKIIP